ncbi:hypothetical protein PDESU_01470 [Pontiella desulfatans]|uniref:PEP-CTERM protein-sorting domain-containing protein n=1 Tax=Pontiella desulfatans TaxID=2750659 RepID=A0A6C2U0J7_PONDE|nr:hypothetical protein [Pontiella desulfatans]VGO12916.1 hypothetical protein PDESU_01470 [Pontiella desulfatans]
MFKKQGIVLLAAAMTALAPFSYGDLNLISLYDAADFADSTSGNFPQVSVPLNGALPSSVYFDIELVNISNLNTQYGSFFGAGFLSSGSFLGEFSIGADTDVGSSDGVFGNLIGNDNTTSASLDSGGIAEGTRVWIKLSAIGDIVSAQVIDQADDSIIYSGTYSIPGVQTADALSVRSFDNEGIIAPTLVTGGTEDYWELRATRTGVDATVKFYGVSIPEPSTIAFVGIFGGGLWFVRRYFPSV